MITLKDVDLLTLQTSHMKQDPTTRALCAALTPHFRQLADEVKACIIYARLNALDNQALDELAWQLHIDWYDPKASLEVKRQLIKNALKVHRYRGTPYAVEQVIQDYFGDGYIEEWFEYGGQPYHFRVITSNSAVTGEQAAQFAMAVEKVKNIRSRLEQIIITMSAEMPVYLGHVLHTGDFITIEQVV
ncbi:MAG: phage tail protein I [Caldicoprobacter oshimai]